MPAKRPRSAQIDELPTHDRKTGLLHAVVEAVRGARAKVAFGPEFNALVVKG